MSTYILVPGGGWGGFIWRTVALLLREAGHEVFTPTLTGLGERVHLASPAIDLDTHIQDIVGVLEYEDVRGVILVGHSYGGMVITGVAERVPERLAQLVYLDAVVPQDGQSDLDLLDPSLVKQAEESARLHGDGWLIPLPLNAPQGMTPHPLKPLQQALLITNPVAAGLPRTFIYCSQSEYVRSGIECLRKAAVRARAEGWRYYELPTEHLAMVTMPKEVADLLLELA